jgi:hypothetical protein
MWQGQELQNRSVLGLLVRESCRSLDLLLREGSSIAAAPIVILVSKTGAVIKLEFGIGNRASTQPPLPPSRA